MNEKNLSVQINSLRNQNDLLKEHLRILSQQLKKISDPKIDFKVDALREGGSFSSTSRYTLSSKEMIPSVCISGFGDIRVHRLEASATAGSQAERVENCPALVRNFQGAYIVVVHSMRGEDVDFDFTIQK